MKTLRTFLCECEANTLTEGEFENLQKHKVPLSDDEHAEVMKRKAVWHHGRDGAPSSAVWKSKHPKTGAITYVTHTHRAYNTASTVKGAISKFHNYIKSTA